MTKQQKFNRLKYCVGCKDNFYNGNNNLGISECWNLETSTFVSRKRVGMWDRPPYDTFPIIKTLSCKREVGYAYLKVNK